MSGRSLRKLPFLAHAYFIQVSERSNKREEVENEPLSMQILNE